MEIRLPYAGIVLLIGPSNSGKSTFLNTFIQQKQILSSEVVSSDELRVLVSDVEFIDWNHRSNDEADGLYDQYKQISDEAFSLMDGLVEKRCRLNKLTFVDATHLHAEERRKYREIASRNHVPIIAIVLDVPQEILLARDEQRNNPRGKRRIKQQHQLFQREKRFIKKEGFFATYFVGNTNEIQLKRKSTNPLHLGVDKGVDIIGDIHGCYDEMIALLEKMGYEKNAEHFYIHPEGRKFLSLGDIMSRGPKSLETMQFFLRHVNAELAYMIDSNHGWKIARWLDGRKVTLHHGDEQVEEELALFQEQYGEERTTELKENFKNLLLHAPSHYVLTKNDVPTVVCTHAGIKDEFIGKQSHGISDFCRYGDSDGLDERGKPIRKDWTVHHKTNALILWGHDPKPKPLVINNTINIDQGAVFGGELTAFRYPEKKFVSIKAGRDYAGVEHNPLEEWKQKRLQPPNLAKFINGYSVLTDHDGEVHVAKEHVIPAIDTISHFTVPIEELIYIPPTMSPAPLPSSLENYLEHPREVIDYYRSKGVKRLVAEKKHMGSRGILFLFKDRRSGLKYVGRETLGIIYTRTGRRFFEEEIEQELLLKINAGLSSYFKQYETEFLLLDAEIMPWNLKAKELISSQYAHVAENALLDRSRLKENLEKAIHTNRELEGWLAQYEEKLEQALIFNEVFQKYCWDVENLKGVQIAPFHLLAHSNETFFHKPHTWHMEKNREFASLVDLFVETEYRVMDDAESEEAVIRWWEEMTSEGHEGIVIKPEFFIPRYGGKLIQPAIKVRGRKYLSIIYGMDYLERDNLSRLKKRNVSKKQRLALKEFSLGVEGIKRFVNEESIERVHECVLATLAMESDPVDPRL